MTPMDATIPDTSELRPRRRLCAWLADLYAGRVDPDELRQPRAVPWYPDEVQQVLDTARSRPGEPLVVSVHRTHGPATVARMRRLDDPRWRAGEYTYSTRTLGRDGARRRTALIVTYPDLEGSA